MLVYFIFLIFMVLVFLLFLFLGSFVLLFFLINTIGLAYLSRLYLSKTSKMDKKNVSADLEK